MKNAREYLEKLSEQLDLPRSVAAGLPQTVISGFREVSVDMQQGLLAYSETEIIVAVSFGCVVITGSGLRIRLMKQGRIVIVGEIDKTEFRRERPA